MLQRKLLSTSSTAQTRKEFWETVRAISDLRKVEKKKEELHTTSHQEKLFKKNPWEFSKSAVRGELGKESVSPAFSKQAADVHYTTTYSNSTETDFSKLNWMPNVKVTPEDHGFKPFNMDPIRPRDIREALKNSNQKSSPGPDGVTFEMLHQLFTNHLPHCSTKF